jgi:hypothetical protein
MNIYEKLTTVQTRLKAPKSQFNSFGKYKYRNCEDILEAIKPLLAEFKLSMVISDDLRLVGDRYYLVATATLRNSEKPDETIIATAMARESENKKGMDDSQVTGAASSYARKYCLNGLFAIDDTKDADTMDGEKPAQAPATVGPKQISSIVDMMNEAGVDHEDFLKYLKVETVESIPASWYPRVINDLKAVLAQKAGVK